MSWSLFSWELACFLSVKVLLQRAQAETPHQRKEGCEAPEKASKPRDLFSTTCLLCNLVVPSVNIHVPLVIVITYIFTAVIPRASVRLFGIFPVLLYHTAFEETSSKQNKRNPNYHPWWKARKEKMIGRKSGTLQAWQESDLVQPPTEKQLQYCWSPLNVLSPHIRSTPPSLTPAFIGDKAPCSRVLISLAVQRSISPGRLLPRISLISKFAVTLFIQLYWDM